jgi:hypothetical protein
VNHCDYLAQMLKAKSEQARAFTAEHTLMAKAAESN